MIVVARTISIFSVTLGISCDDSLALWNGATASEEGIYDTLFMVVLALGGVVLAATLNGLFRQDFTELDIGLGAINAMMVAGLALFCAIPWAFSNPTAPLAKEINALSITWSGSNYVRPFPQEKFIHFNSSNWEEIGPEVWRSEKLGLIKKWEVVWTCFPDGFLEENMRARDPNFDGQLHRHEREWYAYYTLDDEYISAGFHDGESYYPMRYLGDERADKEMIGYMSEVLRNDTLLMMEEYEDLHPDPVSRLYTREEIEAMVEENWKDAD
ncbi:MAG: hypothetical protein ABNH53_03970 [Henriciella sp.]